MLDYRKILDGEVYVVSEFPNKDLLHKKLLDGFLHAIERIAGPVQAQRARREGIERLHEFMRPQDLPRIIDAFKNDLEVSYTLYRFAAEFARDVLGVPGEPWIDGRLVPRIFPPHASMLAHSAELLSRPGSLETHAPHVESWNGHPRDEINLWYAIGNVMPGNGMIIYRDDWGRPLRHDPNRYLSRGQKVGRPDVYPLSPGSVLVFAGEHLHSSHVNVTRDTRVAVTVRLSLDGPKGGASSRRLGWYRSGAILQGDPRLGWGGLQSLVWRQYHELNSYLGRVYRVQRFKMRTRRASRTATPRAGLRRDEAEQDRGALIRLGPVENFPPDSSLSVGTPHGVFSVFNRAGALFITDDRCPHRGASLADGWCEGTQVTCPWHGLTFDLSTGRCVNFSPMRIQAYQPVVKDRMLFVGPPLGL